MMGGLGAGIAVWLSPAGIAALAQEPRPPGTTSQVSSGPRGGWRIGSDLAGTRWRLEELGGRRLEPATAPTLEFLRDLQVRGSTGCRRYVGPFASRADKGVFGPLRTSEEACEPALEGQEAIYLERLQSAWRMRLEEESQVLLAFPRRGDSPLRFVRLP
jgi:META domain